MGRTSSIEDRVILVAIPMFRNARAAAGRIRWAPASPTVLQCPAIVQNLRGSEKKPRTPRKASTTDMWVGRGNVGDPRNSPDDGNPTNGPTMIARTMAPRYVGVAHPLR